MASPSISIGDLLRAAVTLGVRDAATLERMADFLGIRAAAPAASAAAAAPVQPPPVPGPKPDTGGRIQDRPQNLQPPQSPGSIAPRDLSPRAASIETLPGTRFGGRPPRDVPSLEQLLAAPDVAPAAVDTSLFDPRWQRGIVTAAISTQSPDGPIDVARLVEDIANGLAVRRLPRVPLHTTRKGLQVLIDIADGMRPFADDVDRVERLLRLTAGDDGVDLLRFEHEPLERIGRGTRGTWKRYAPPPAGTPVLVVSDFGLAAAHAATAQRAWRTVAAMLKPQGSPLLALTPFPSSRWPAWLTQIVSPIQWDRPTNATTARRAAERGARA